MRVRGVTKVHDVHPSTSVGVCLKRPAQRTRDFVCENWVAGEVPAPVGSKLVGSCPPAPRSRAHERECYYAQRNHETTWSRDS